MNQSLNHLPHGIRGLVQTPGLPQWLWILLFLLLGVAICLLAFWYFKNKKQKPPEPVLTSHPLDVLYKEIKELLPPVPFDSKKTQQSYYYKLSLLFREFLETSFDIRATDLTTKELGKELPKQLPIRHESIDEIVRLLGFADLIKFADKVASVEEAQLSHQKVLGWITTLLPRELEDVYKRPASNTLLVKEEGEFVPYKPRYKSKVLTHSQIDSSSDSIQYHGSSAVEEPS